MAIKSIKKAIQVFLLTVLVSAFSGSLYSAGVTTVDMKKVDKFIEVVYNYIKASPINKEVDWNQLSKIIEQQNLNDDEYFEVQKKIAKQIDVAYYREHMMDLPRDKYDGAYKWWVYELARSYPMHQLEKKMTKEQIVMTKIMPVIEKSSNEMKVEWLIVLEGLHNEVRTLSDKNRVAVTEYLINIFSNKKNPLKLKVAAVDAWAGYENREQKIYEAVDTLIKDGKTFKESVGSIEVYLTDDAPKLYEKMFKILKNREEYPNEVIEGVLVFFRKYVANLGLKVMSGGTITETERNRVKQLETIVSGIKAQRKTGDDEISEHCKEILEMIAEGEQEGRYK